MKINILFLLIVLLSLSLSAQNNEERNLFVGTFTSEGAEGIYLCHFNSESGEIALKNIFKGIDNPSFLEISPDRNHLYAVSRPDNEVDQSGGYVQSYHINKGGELQFINKQSSHGKDPCHIDVSPDGRFAAIATYGSGTVSLYSINTNGGLNEASITIFNQGSGPNPSRQKAPHAHSVLFSPDGSQLFSADLGTDLLSIFDLKEDKIISAKQQSNVKLTPGSGPRHFTFHPDSKTIYVINELNSMITVLKKKDNKWEEQQTISTIPEGFTEANYCADIHVSADGSYLYGSNRGHNSIAVYEIDKKTKQLDWITSVPTQGEWPRNFILSEDGRFLLAANQKSGNITVFKINPKSGIPEFTGNEIKLPSPVCLVIQ